MGIAERKIKERQDLEKLILDAAMEVFLEKGYDGISIRDIADKIEYSPTTIYLYYKDKDAILYALHCEGFCMMNAKMQVLQYIADPFERLKAMGKIYIDFALANKNLYGLMFSRQAPIECMDEEDKEWEEGKNTFEALKLTVQECVKQGYFNCNDVESTSFAIWAAMHGMCSLQIDNRGIKVISENKRDRIVHLGYVAFVEMLESLNKKTKS